jgi:hypothetical protein
MSSLPTRVLPERVIGSLNLSKGLSFVSRSSAIARPGKSLLSFHQEGLGSFFRMERSVTAVKNVDREAVLNEGALQSYRSAVDQAFGVSSEPAIEIIAGETFYSVIVPLTRIIHEAGK